MNTDINTTEILTHPAGAGSRAEMPLGSMVLELTRSAQSSGAAPSGGVIGRGYEVPSIDMGIPVAGVQDGAMLPAGGVIGKAPLAPAIDMGTTPIHPVSSGSRKDM